MRDSWDEQGNHLQEAWTAQGQYLRKAWNELTARVQDMLKRDNDNGTQPTNNRDKPVESSPTSPDDISQPAPDSDDTRTRSPHAGERHADRCETNPESHPVGDGRYGHGVAGPLGHGGPGPTNRGHSGPGGGGNGGGGGDGGGGGGGSMGPTGGAGPTGQMRNMGPAGDAASPRIDRGMGASQFSQAALNRLNSAPQNLMHILDLALKRLDKYGANDPELQQWFGKNADVNEIRRTLTRMQETLASGDYKISLDPGTRDGWEMAHVFPNDTTHTIHVRPHMLDAVFGKNTPEVTIAHELSHFNDISGTRDLKYGDWNALSLARTNSTAAMHNAENYGMFIRQVAQLPEVA
ncbi:M35 family metallo-endopeptidase [Paraburkholderia humisilvae]|nr:M35 family metallo-endopeptidase [Paraburkholderia humisilvae]